VRGGHVVSYQEKYKGTRCTIIDIATCAFDHITASGDVEGNVIVWPKNMKSGTKKIITGQHLSVINILRKQVFCGNFTGQIMVYSAQSGNPLAEVDAHCRQVTALSVAPESAYILTASEDTYIRAWKLYSRDMDKYKIEFRDAVKLDNTPILGAAFSSLRGSGLLISYFENQRILCYKIGPRKPDE